VTSLRPQNAELQRNLSSAAVLRRAQRHKARFELMFERRVVLTSQAGEASSRAQAGSTALFDKGAPRNYSVLPGHGSFRTTSRYSAQHSPVR